MNQIVVKTGLLALSTGSLLYLQHNWSRRRVLALQNTETDIEGLTKRQSKEDAGFTTVQQGREDPLVLQLCQVQVMFRHGARTPIYTIPNVPEVEYVPELVSLDHQASVFPYERVCCVDGSRKEWSSYEKIHAKRLLRGGASAGSLTGLGKEQTYLLGQQLRDNYMQRLGVATFDPEVVRILSSNVKRTVESALGVLAGFFSKEHLTQYAKTNGPVKIEISDGDYNILIPNTHGCEVLKKNNHSAMVHPDFLEGFKEQRVEMEAHIRKPRQRLYDSVSQVQARIDVVLHSKGTRTQDVKLNRHRQHYQHDPLLQPLYEERGQAIARVDRFWANVLNRDPTLSQVIIDSDMKALVYLRNLEVERFEGTLNGGYRIHFYFDKNPYFYNRHLCKEVFTNSKSAALLSKQTQILWQPDRNLIEETESIKHEGTSEQGKDKTDETSDLPKSFFHWFVQPIAHGSDKVGDAIRGEVWRNPFANSEREPRVSDHWDRHLNFVFCRDDAVARVTHGLPYPPEVLKYERRIDENAASILYLSLAGRTPQSREVVTRLSAGPLLTEMFDQAQKVVCGERGLKLCLYSSHDSTMSCLMESLGIWDNAWPPFASDLRLELYQEVDGTDFFVRVLYNGKEQIIRGQTDSFVRWANFVESVKPYLIRREEQEAVCKSDILERIAQEVLRHEKGEVETEEIKEESETPAGM